jgi:hypothetical protein
VSISGSILLLVLLFSLLYYDCYFAYLCYMLCIYIYNIRVYMYVYICMYIYIYKIYIQMCVCAHVCAMDSSSWTHRFQETTPRWWREMLGLRGHAPRLSRQWYTVEDPGGFVSRVPPPPDRKGCVLYRKCQKSKTVVYMLILTLVLLSNETLRDNLNIFIMTDLEL